VAATVSKNVSKGVEKVLVQVSISIFEQLSWEVFVNEQI
jgi:hypothetical protein